MSETGIPDGPTTPEELYRAFVAPRPAGLTEMAHGLRQVGLAHVIMENLDDVLSYVKTRPDLRRAQFYQKLDSELDQMDNTAVARITVICDWLGLGFIPRSDKFGLHNELEELLRGQNEIQEFAGSPDAHGSTADSYRSGPRNI